MNSEIELEQWKFHLLKFVLNFSLLTSMKVFFKVVPVFLKFWLNLFSTPEQIFPANFQWDLSP